jgi:uncharacterized protein YecT (DUF1311 family)
MKDTRITQRSGARAIAFLLSAAMCASCERQSASVTDTPQAAAQKTVVEQPCAAADSQAAMTRCWGEEATAAEQHSTATYEKVLNWLQERQQDDVVKLFRETQARWESFRNAHCDSIAAVYDGGSIAGLQQAQCRLRLAEARTRELELVMSDANN